MKNRIVSTLYVLLTLAFLFTVSGCYTQILVTSSNSSSEDPIETDPIYDPAPTEPPIIVVLPPPAPAPPPVVIVPPSPPAHYKPAPVPAPTNPGNTDVRRESGNQRTPSNQTQGGTVESGQRPARTPR